MAGLELILIRTTWLFLYIRAPCFGGSQKKSPTILGSVLGPLIFGNSQLSWSSAV